MTSLILQPMLMTGEPMGESRPVKPVDCIYMFIGLCSVLDDGWKWLAHISRRIISLISYVKKSKGSSYIAQYPILRTVQSALHFTSLTDLFTQTPSRLLWEASSHMLQLMREGCSYTYPPLSIARYSFNSAE